MEDPSLATPILHLGNPAPLSATKQLPYSMPLVLRAIRVGFHLLGPVLPAIAGRLAYRMWFATQRFPAPAREEAWSQSARRRALTTSAGPVMVYRWGEQGPIVLLMHGWSGRATQLGAFVAPLLAAGYQVITFDAPAHGNSPGRRTNMLQMAAAMRKVVTVYGPVKAVIAHSFGAAVTLYALRHLGLQTEKAVNISAPAQMHYLYQHYCNIVKLPHAARTVFEQELYNEFGHDIWERVSPDNNAANLKPMPVLLIHDEQDQDVVFSQATLLQQAWSGSRLAATQGLGHRRILRDPGVIEQVVAFIDDK